jgi:hypothetical protein
MDDDAILAEVLALLQQEIGEPWVCRSIVEASGEGLSHRKHPCHA